ncbi:hypothetical protein KSP39_PZI022268 [Platanthera zijinensis]|uniref:Uncharacterized protein n=1 Tax=Platanthera zijinensis TaxID=2320716 RepID=A0AAP0FUF3_9ASPA
MDTDQIMEDIEYVKAYQRCQHLYFESRLKQIHEDQVQIMHANKMPVNKAQLYKMQTYFNEDEYLLNSDRSRVDPVQVIVAAKTEEEEDDSDEE